jgi:2-amino-4-hydroxy-6-hydroxymethyldihydropteridine diphosphokinase
MTAAAVPAYVAVGSSLEPLRHVAAGLRRLHRRCAIEAASPFYWSAALGADGRPRRGDPDFLNGMVRVRTRLGPLALRRVLHQVEAEEGRVRGPDRHAPRTLDLDLVVYAGEVVDGDLPLRRHLAVPLLDLEPRFEVVPGTPLRDPGGPPLRAADPIPLPFLHPPSPVQEDAWPRATI